MAAGDVFIAVCPHDENSLVDDGSREEVEEEERRSMCPVQVVEDDEQRAVGGSPQEEAGNCVEKAEPRLLRAFPQPSIDIVGHEATHFGDDIGYFKGAPPHLRAETVGICVLDVGADGLNPCPVWGRSRFFVAASPEHMATAFLGIGFQFSGGSGLADSRLARDHDDASRPLDRRIEMGAHSRKFRPSTHERGHVGHRGASLHLVGHDRLRAPRVRWMECSNPSGRRSIRCLTHA